MRVTSRRKTIAFFVVLGVCLVALAVALNVGWIILNWRQGVLGFSTLGDASLPCASLPPLSGAASG